MTKMIGIAAATLMTIGIASPAIADDTNLDGTITINDPGLANCITQVVQNNREVVTSHTFDKETLNKLESIQCLSKPDFNVAMGDKVKYAPMKLDEVTPELFPNIETLHLSGWAVEDFAPSEMELSFEKI